MLLWFVIVYWLISVGIGLFAATRVHNTKDFAVAGRHLPFYMVTATVFATWFGSEAVLGIPATFLNEGLHGVVADPFGSSMCLILVGLFFAAPLYRMNLLTIGDFYKKRYGRGVEVLYLSELLTETLHDPEARQVAIDHTMTDLRLGDTLRIGRTLMVLGVMASLFTDVTRHSAEDVSSSSWVSGTIWRMVFASRAATRKAIRSSSRIGSE